MVKLLEESGYDGPRHFDAHPMRAEDENGVWDFAAGCMHTYLVLADKAREFAENEAIQDALQDARAGVQPPLDPYSHALGQGILAKELDPDALAAQGAGAERLDQLVVDLLLGSL